MNNTKEQNPQIHKHSRNRVLLLHFVPGVFVNVHVWVTHHVRKFETFHMLPSAFFVDVLTCFFQVPQTYLGITWNGFLFNIWPFDWWKRQWHYQHL